MLGLFYGTLSVTSVGCIIMPLTKPNGSVDLISVLNHITLLEQQMEKQADTTTQIADLKAMLQTTQTELQQLKTHLASVEEALNVSHRGTATFIRWGNTTCPDGNQVVYKGYAGGTQWDNKASNANLLCLPENPIYAEYTQGGHTTTIHGSEYELDAYPSGSRWRSLDDEDVPCVVCASETKKSTIMVPGRNKCHPSWDLEYWGYLMGVADSTASGEYVCVDNNPGTIAGGKANHNGHSFHFVESVCEPLPCPPYENNWELTCAVCSR